MGVGTNAAAFAAVLCSVATALGFLAWWRPGSRTLVGIADLAGAVTLLAAAVAWGLRVREAGHLPLFGTYESALSLTVAVLIAVFVGRVLGGVSARIWPLGCAVAAAILAHGARFDPTPYALTISERSWVVDVHAVLAWLAFGTLAVNACHGLALVVGTCHATERGEAALSFSLRLGFALHSGMMASGSFYKFLLFGTAWSFDPVETLGFVAWIAYGTLLHLHLMGGWAGRRLAGWCLAVFVLLVVSYRCIVYFPPWSTYHIFDMDRRIHLSAEDLGAGGG